MEAFSRKQQLRKIVYDKTWAHTIEELEALVDSL